MKSRKLPVEFKVSDTHQSRRDRLVKEYPAIKSLVEVDPMTKVWVTLNVLAHLCMSLVSVYIENRLAFFLFCYFVGATLAHCLFLAIHELSHNSAFATIKWNQGMGVFANLPLLIPYSATFRRYHLQHHFSLGEENDTDIPSSWECYLVSHSATCRVDHALRKMVYLSIYILFYALRPLVLRPDIFKWSDEWFMINTLVQIFFNLGLYHCFGSGPFVYLLLSMFLAGSLHPLSGRFLSEHLVLSKKDEVETYSYYGPENWITYNVGYHVSSHFPRAPVFRASNLHHVCPSRWNTTTFRKYRPATSPS